MATLVLPIYTLLVIHWRAEITHGTSIDGTLQILWSSSLSFSGATATFLPVDGNTIEVASGYFTQQNYVIHFDDNGGVLSNFTVTPSAAMLADFDANGITITDGPTLTFGWKFCMPSISL